ADEARPRTSSASASCDPIFRRGLSDEYGFWKTIWSLARSRGRPRLVKVVSSRPSNSTVPAVVGTSPTDARARLDFPQPDSPTSPTIWPRSTVRLAPATARRRSRPRRSYTTSTSWRSSAGPSAFNGTLSFIAERVDVAGEAATAGRNQRRVVRRADLDRVRTPRVVATAVRDLLRARRRPLDRHERRVPGSLGVRQRIEEGTPVRGPRALAAP